MVGNGGIATENIDEVILGLLKLEDGGAVTYQTYYDRIKKKLMMARMGGSELPHEEDQLLRDELKRIRLIQDKTKVFKIKSKPRNNSTPPPPRSSRRGSSGAPKSSAIVKNKKGKLGFQDPSIKRVNVTDVTQPTVRAPKDSIYDVLVRIDGLVGSILQTLTQTSRLDARNRERERIRGEEAGREGRERRLESKGGLKPIVEAVKKIMAPFQSIWDRIVNFFVNVFLGKIAVSLFKWLADPENKGKVKSIIRFLKDWWPALVGGYLLFGTSFGKLIRTIIPSVTRFIFQLGKVAIPRLLTFVRNPFVAGTLLFTAGATIPALFPGTANGQERKTKNAPGSKEEKIRKLEEQKANLNFFEKLQGKGSEIDEQIQYLKTGNTKSYGFAGGGYAGKLKKLLHRDQKPNSSSRLIRGPGGPTGDKIPAMLSDGEFVMSAAAVKKHGIQKLEAMNAAAGGTNTPRVINGRTHAAGGGYIGKDDYNTTLENILKYFKSQGVDINNPGSWMPKGTGQGISYAGSQFNRALSGARSLPGQGLSYLNSQVRPIRSAVSQGLSYTSSQANQALTGARSLIDQGRSYLGGQYNRAINDPRVQQAIGAGRQVLGKGQQFVSGIKNKVIGAGYLSSRGRFEGAARAQALNFASEILPNLPGVSDINKSITESYLTKIGLGRNTKNYRINEKGERENYTQAFYGGSSGIDRAHNVGQLQVNKMSDESRNYYLKKIRTRLASGTIKSGDMIDAYDLPSNSPIRREQGTVRFYIGPDGSPYLTDTYGFDPGHVNLGSAEAQYQKQLANFQNPKTIQGRFAKLLNLKPLADATEGGGPAQYILALRNKIFGYDPEKEAKAKLGMRFKTKVQVEELRKLMKPDELKAFLKLSKEQLSLNEQTLLEKANSKNDADKKKQELASKRALNQKKLEAKRPWWDKLGTFGGASAEMEKEKERQREISRSTGMGGKYNFTGSRQREEANRRRLEEQRPWWDKFGTFGGTAAERRRQSEQRRQQFLSTGMGGKYDFSSQRQREEANRRRLEEQRPWWDKFGTFGGATAEQRRRQQQQQQARISRSTSRSTTTTPPRPPSTRRGSGRTTTTTVRSGGNRSGGSNRNGSSTPRFSSSHGRSSGRMVSASAYGIYR